MAQDLSFHQVLAGLRAQDNEAATRVYNRFARRLIALARGQLNPRVLQRLDAEDVVQSVFKSVFLRLGEGQFEVGSWDSLWALLAAIAVNKSRKWVDYYQAQARDLDREKPLNAGTSDSSWQVIDREPTPPEALALTETLEQILKDLEEREQTIVSLSLQGYEVAEISSHLGCTESKVYRLLRLVRHQLEKMRGETYEI